MSSYRPGQPGGYRPAGDLRYQQPQQQPQPQSPFDDQFNALTPKSVISLAVWVLMFGLGAGLSGLLLFVFYQGEVNDLRSELLDAQQELRNSLEGRIEQIENAPRSPSGGTPLSVSETGRDLEQVRAELAESIGPAIAGVRGFDVGFVGTEGSGFVVNSPGGTAWVVTNYTLVAGADPEFPNTGVRIGHIHLSSEVYETDPGHGLALLIFNDGVSRSLRFAGSSPAQGDTLWVAAASASRPYVTLSEAEVLSDGASLILEAEVSSKFSGGPVVDERGRVVGIVPTLISAGNTAEKLRFTVTPIDRVCLRILRCPGSEVDGQEEGESGEAASPEAEEDDGASPQDEVPAQQESNGPQQITG